MQFNGYFRTKTVNIKQYIPHIVIAILAVGLLGYLLESSWSLGRGAYENVSVNQLDKMMSAKDFLLINVHIPYEGEIPRTDLFIPFNALEKYGHLLPKDKDVKIVVYCLAGPMGQIAAEKLTAMGYTRVFNLGEGMKGWRRQGKPILYKSR